MEDRLHADIGDDEGPPQGGAAGSRGGLDRAGAIGGIAFTVLAFASTFVVPVAPAVDDSAAEIRDYLTDHQTALGVSTVLYTTAMLAFVAFLAMVHRRIAATARSAIAAGTFLVAGTACITFGLLGGLLHAALVQRIAPDADDSLVAALYAVWDMVSFTGPPLAINVAVLVAAVVLYRDPTVPRWLAAVAAASVALGVAAVVADLASGTGLPVALDLGGFALANVWIVVLSVVVLRDRTAAGASSELGTGTVPARPAVV